jgi:adenine-specific DNA methylase
MPDYQLIEVEIPLPAINTESDTDKRTHDGHISTLHVWWARRPLPMSRAVVYASLLPDPGDTDRSVVTEELAAVLPFGAATTERLLAPLKQRLRLAHPAKPKVLDCFAGGGAIPLEALRLGCDVTAFDLNPVANLLERGSLVFPQQFNERDGFGRSLLAKDVEKWAVVVADRTAAAVATLFPPSPGRTTPAPIYFWVRTMPSPDPDVEVEIPILSSRLLAEGRRSAWVEVTTSRDAVRLDVHNSPPPEELDVKKGFEAGGSVTCPISGATAPQRDVKLHGTKAGFGYRLYAVLDIKGRDRSYRNPTAAEVQAAESASDALERLDHEYPDGTSMIPDEAVDEIAYNNLQFLPYGYSTWRSLFTPRQLVLFATMAQEIRRARSAMEAEGMRAERADAVATYLAFVMDKVMDRNSAFSSWATSRETIRGTFPGQTVQMRWDFCENYPFRTGTGSWDDALDAVVKVIEHCTSIGSEPARVERGDAQALPYGDEEFDAVVIDPPYYQSVMYSDLSDFFYVWLKRSLGDIYPKLFETPWTPKSAEIVQNRCHSEHPRYISEAEFDQRLDNALRQVARVVKRNGIVSIVFAHTDVKAWEKLLRSLQAVGLVVTTSWPIRSEMKGRTVAHVNAALASSVLLVCRPTDGGVEGFYDDVVRELERRLPERLDEFDAMGLSGADYFVSAIGPAFEVFARYSRVVRLSGETVDVSDLMVLAREIVARHAIGRLLGGETLRALDEESLLYLTWRWAYLSVAIPADDAMKLERAFSVDLGELTRPGGFVHKAGAKYSLLGPHQRKDVKVGAVPRLIDVLHLACQLWDTGRRQETTELLGATGFGTEPGFWATARALAEILPDGDRERTMLQGFTASQDRLAAESGRFTGTSVEELTLFER